MTDVRIHMSFDLEHDRDLQDRLVKQARRPAPFAIASRSEGGEMTEAWTERVRGCIAESDEVVVICGEHTDQSPHVSAELAIAQQQHKPYVLLWGRRDSMCKKPKGARSDEGMYMWTPGILEHQLAYNLRQSRERVVPEGMKRQVPHGGPGRVGRAPVLPTESDELLDRAPLPIDPVPALAEARGDFAP